MFDTYCMGTLFNISKKYPATITTIRNFVIAKLKEIKSMNTKDLITVEKASELTKSNQNFFNFIKNTEEGPGANMFNHRDHGPRRIASRMKKKDEA